MKVYNTLITINDDGNVHTKLETFSNIDSAAKYLFCEHESLKEYNSKFGEYETDDIAIVKDKENELTWFYNSMSDGTYWCSGIVMETNVKE